MGERKIAQAAWVFDDVPAAVSGLAEMIAFDFDKIDQWFEEDEQIHSTHKGLHE